MDKPKCWFKNVQLKVKVEAIFNPTFGFVHILPNLKQPSIV